MDTKTDYHQEITRLIDSFYAPVTDPSLANDSAFYKTLSGIHADVTNILPSKWVDQQDVYKVLAELGFKAFPKEDRDGNTTFFYYLEPK